MMGRLGLLQDSRLRDRGASQIVVVPDVGISIVRVSTLCELGEGIRLDSLG